MSDFYGTPQGSTSKAIRCGTKDSSVGEGARTLLAWLRRRPPYAGRGGLGNLAEALGVSLETVRSWVSGRRQPNADNLSCLSALAREKDKEANDHD